MSHDLKTRVEKVIDRTCYVVNGENVSNLVKDLCAEKQRLEAELAQERAWRSSDNKSLVKEIEDFQGENQRLEEENAALRRDVEWRPISTRPSLDDRVLMWWTPIDHNPYAESVTIGKISVTDEDYLAEEWRPTKYWDGHYKNHYTEGYKDLSRITHWMPLPKRPKALAAKGGEDE